MAAAIILLLLAALAGFLFYTPPLLNGAGYNLPGRAFDILAYVYYSSRMEWFDTMDKSMLARRAAAQAAWYRPSRMKELLRVSSDDFFQLGREYAGLELDGKALLLFKAAFPAALADEKKSLEIVSYLAILGDWPGTLEAAEALLQSYPGAAAGEYWRGRALLEMERADQAVSYLRRAYQLQPSLIDALYRIGEVDEIMGRKEKALDRYGEVVSRLPGHLGACEGLVRLYPEGGEAEKALQAREECRELTPPVPWRRRINNVAVLKGYGMMETGTSAVPLDLELYLEGWTTGDRQLGIGLRLLSDSCPEELILPVEVRPAPRMGEVAKVRVRRNFPPILYPGHIDLVVDFTVSGAEGKESKRTVVVEKPFISFRLKPGWASAVIRPDLIEEKFGPGAGDLGRKTFLGPGDEVKLNLAKVETVVGVGIVSFLHRGSSVPRGTTVGRLFVETADQEEYDFPVIAGRDTAEVWWESLDPWLRKHERAPVFRSWRIDLDKKQFKAHEYYAIVFFPRPLAVKTIRMKNLSPGSGWYISDLVMIPPGDKIGL